MPFESGPKGETKWISPDKAPKPQQLSEKETSAIVEIAEDKRRKELGVLKECKKRIKKEIGLSPAEIFEKMFRGETVSPETLMMASKYFYEGAYSEDYYEGELVRVGRIPETRGEGRIIPRIMSDLDEEMGKIRQEAYDKQDKAEARRTIENSD